VEREKAAGVVVIGKTNTPEFGAGSRRSALAPLADGSDTGGSLRNPASFCNVVGLRPSPGRVPIWPAQLAWSTLSVDGPMSRTVQDVALHLSAIAGPDPRSPIALPESGTAFGQPLETDFRGDTHRLGRPWPAV
jgi:amidase